MRKNILLFSATSVFCAMSSFPLSAQSIKTVVDKKAEPFPLSAVKLLDSPFLERQKEDTEYLVNFLNPDRLLAAIRERAGLPKKAERYGGWEAQGINGHGLGHYMSALAACYSVTGNVKAKEKLEYILNELEECQIRNGDGYVMSVDKKVYERVKSGNFTIGGFDINGWWVPNYTLHKIFAGLRDAYRYAGLPKALEIERKLGDWYLSIVSPLNDEQIQKLLGSEWGGMNETFCQLGEDTGDKKYLEAAEKYFNHKRIFDPLKRGEDRLTGLHANTQVPKIAGLALLYELTGNQEYHTAVETFWNSVVNERSFANGGHSDSEHFFDVRQFPTKLGPKNSETCNVNNMIRLTGHTFQWNPTANQMDFIERALYNQILANIGHKGGEFGYFISQKPVAMKVFSTKENAWWCCVGTGMENPMHYGEHIYYHKGNQLWINLYIASKLDWKEQSVVLEQTTDMLNTDISEFIIHTTNASNNLALKFRIPYWCKNPILKINDKQQSIQAKPSSYVEISRIWKDGDKISLTMPKEFHIDPLPYSNNKYVAIMYGPLVMTGVVPPEKGKEDLAKRRWDDHLRASGGTNESATLLVTDDPQSIVKSLKMVENNGSKGMLAVSENLGKPQEVKLMPFYQIYEEHYTMYFPVIGTDSWKKEQERIEAAAAEERRLEALRTDVLMPGFQQDEVNHDFHGNNSESGDFRDRKYRHARGAEGWYSYKMRVSGNSPMKLVVTYYSEDRGREFEIYVDDTKLITEKLNMAQRNLFYDKVYEIPQALTQGKETVTIKFQGTPSTSYVGGIFKLVMTK